MKKTLKIIVSSVLITIALAINIAAYTEITTGYLIRYYAKNYNDATVGWMDAEYDTGGLLDDADSITYIHGDIQAGISNMSMWAYAEIINKNTNHSDSDIDPDMNLARYCKAEAEITDDYATFVVQDADYFWFGNQVINKAYSAGSR
ncbi:MAG: hypothetical protein A2Y15_03995 [Clostridiales bacterium GWF2_36_10]|nr:MAG: hypothetical protein A2Y15_03995 [Clostridiales bacterium GWF2_36_10]HAN20333.1 hypothetical protein [Clostridiales bacterium]